MPPQDQDDVYWLSIIGRALLGLALQAPDMRSLSITEKAKFLTGSGLTYRHAAEMLGTTEASLRELARQAKQAKKGKKNGKKKSSKQK